MKKTRAQQPLRETDKQNKGGSCAQNNEENENEIVEDEHMFMSVWAEACFHERYRCVCMLFGFGCTCLRTQCDSSGRRGFICFPKLGFCVQKKKKKRIKGIAIELGSTICIKTIDDTSPLLPAAQPVCTVMLVSSRPDTCATQLC